jgi:hypothetical protein
MNKRVRMGLIGTAALALATGAGPFAFAKGGPSGNMNLRLSGYEVIGGGQVSILAIGQVISDSGGTFSGNATMTATDGTETDVCAVNIPSAGGQITKPAGGFSSTTGLFTITMTGVAVSPTTGPNSTFCADNTGATFTLSCNRTLVHKNLVNDLDAGQYHCVVTGITGASAVTGQSMEGHLDIVSGSNSPTS